MGFFDKIGNPEKIAEKWFKMAMDAKIDEKKIEYFNRSLDANPQNADAWYNKGNALYDLGRKEEAIKCYDKALEINPKKDAAWYNKGVVLYDLGRKEEAIKCYDKALEINPKKDAAWYNKGVVLDGLGRKEEAIKCYDKALEINPKKDAAWYNKGVVLSALGRKEEAIKCYDKALEINPKKDAAWYNKGVVLYDLGRKEEAIKCYDKALEINPKDDSAWYGKGYVLDGLGRKEEAIKCYDKALEINPKKDAAWYGKGYVLDGLGRKEEAIKCYDKSLEINPKDDSAWYNKGNALDDLGRKEEAIKCYDKSLEINPKKDEAWNNKGNALDDLGRKEEAIKCYDKALEINPKDDSAWYGKGYVLDGLGRKEEAIKCYDKSLEINPEKDEALKKKEALLREINNKNKDATITVLDDAENAFEKVQHDGFTFSDKKLEAARKCFEAANYAKAMDLANQFKSQLVRQQKREVSENIKELEELLSKIQSLNVLYNKDLLYEAKRYFDDGNYIEVMSLAKIFKYQIMNELKQKASKVMIASEEALAKAKASKIEIDEDTFNEARKLFDEQNYIESIEAYNKLNGRLKSLIGKSREDAEKEIKWAESVHEKFVSLKAECDDILLQKAKICFKKMLYVEAIEHSKSFTVMAEDLLSKLKPLISIEIFDIQFKLNCGRKTVFLLKNTGNIAVKNISVEISGDADIRMYSGLLDLDSASSKEIDIWLKTNIEGDLPLDVTVKYKDGLNRDYVEEKEMWINSTGTYSNTIPAPAKEENRTSGQGAQANLSAASFPAELFHLYSNPKLIGEGGFGRIFIAKTKKDNDVAVKIPASWDEATAKSFLREMTVWQNLSHENIISMNDLNIYPLPYLELEYANGGSLEDVSKPIDVKTASKIMFDISEGLKYAHGKGIIHCDLKPQNILMVSEGLKHACKNGISLQGLKPNDFIKAEDMVPKITDWGLSKLPITKKSYSKSGYSPLYAAPELISPAKFGKLDFRTDIYQLGIIFYELVTGRLPFDGQDHAETIFKKINGDVKPPSTINSSCSELDGIILKCLSKEQNSRYQTISDFQQDLAQYLNIEYNKSLALSRDRRQSCLYCAKLLEVYAKIGSITEAIKYAQDLRYHTCDLFSAEMDAVIENLKYRAKRRLSVDNQLITEIDIVIHQIMMDSK
ncbi:tetratricopeptide repeat protein [uncultured Methanomethylovorans sp.]|uniref:tetratricopeptide repeat protein n=1 Tax=uncultured Methanomethylovorans sp. TaxID=183759 RepID=UPI002AA658FF|nr:tetratricopeptide repeat protein [uncultured Methanomethylovorans sp.]